MAIFSFVSVFISFKLLKNLIVKIAIGRLLFFYKSYIIVHIEFIDQLNQSILKERIETLWIAS